MLARLKKWLIAGGVVGVLLIIWFFLLDSAKPNAGEEIVLVHKPLIFGHGGVDPTPVRTGQQYVWFTTSQVKVDMQPQQMGVHFEDLMSSDGVPLDFDSVIRLQVVDSVRLVTEFGPKWYENNVLAEFRNRIRQEVRQHGMNETAIDNTAIDKIDHNLRTQMEATIKEANLPVRLMDVTVGKANPPDSIKDQRVQTAAEQQRIKTEEQRKLAEDSRKAAEVSRAEADNAYRNAMGMSPELFVSLENIKMQREVCKQGGACTFIVGSGVEPVINASPNRAVSK